jgi:Tfp pilus assembly protein PilP
MKKKKVTVAVLLVLCLVIWGTIAYKIYAAFGEEVAPLPTLSVAQKTEKRQDSRLLLNYKDPFLGVYTAAKLKERAAEVPVVDKQPVAAPHPVAPIPTADPDFIYTGFLKTAKGVKAIISISGKNRQVKVGDKIGDFTVRSIEKKRLFLGAKGKSYELEIR